MGYSHALILGILQGLAEFLPVSSSGHLVILQVFMGLKDASENITFDIFLHIATLLAVAYVYRKNLAEIFKSPTVESGDTTVPKWKLLGMLMVSILGTGIILPFKDQLSSMFETIDGVRIFLIINGIALAVLPLMRKGELSLNRLTWSGALVIGLAQAAGALPGISRSGSTILAGLLLGLSPKEACRYSFLLAIPTILVAALVQIPDALEAGLSFEPGPMALGFIVAFVSGLIAIPLLIGIVEKGKLWGFSIYCCLVGIALFIVNPPG